MALFNGFFGLDAWFGSKAKISGRDPQNAAAAPLSLGAPIAPDAALRIAAVWACVRLLSETVGTLPLGLYTKDAQGRRAPAPDHGLYGLLHDSPNADQSAAEFWEAVVACLALWGNFYAEKGAIGGRVVALNLMRPDLVSIYRDRLGGRRYQWRSPAGLRDMAEAEVFHVRGFGVGLDAGLSPIGYARATLGGVLAADTSARTAITTSARPSGFLVVPGKPTREQKEDLKATFLDPITGPSATASAAVLEQGQDWKTAPPGIPLSDLQLLETRGFHVEEVCRWFRVPPFMIGHSEKSTSWGTGLEQQNIGFLTYALRPYLVRIEQAVKKQLITPAERATVYAEFNLEGLLRADSAGRAALYSMFAQNGVSTRNELRARENLPPMEGGDVLTVQSNLVPLEKLGEVPAADTPDGFGLPPPPPKKPSGGEGSGSPAAPR